MKVKYVKLEDKGITKEMLEEFPIVANSNYNNIYDLGYIIEKGKIYKAYYSGC